jgi:hypothetical protein
MRLTAIASLLALDLNFSSRIYWKESPELSRHSSKLHT